MSGLAIDDDGAAVRSPYRIEALAKGLQVLRLFDEHRTSLRLRDVADLTGIPMPTAFRIVSTLEEEGFLERDEDGVVRPGVAVLMLGSAALHGAGIVQAAERPLRALAAQSGETVNLGVLQGDRVLYLVRLRNADIVTANVEVGSTLPAAFTSMGKVLLAALPDSEVRRRLPAGTFAVPHGPNAVPSANALADELATIREQGWAVQDQQLALGLRSVAVPVLARNGATVAAVNIAVSTSRRGVESLHDELLPLLQRAATEIALRLAGA